MAAEIVTASPAASRGPTDDVAGLRPGRPLSRYLTGAGVYLTLLLFLVIFLVPFFWIWFSALKSSIEIARDPFGLPNEWLWSNLKDAWTTGRFDRYLLNSVIY